MTNLSELTTLRVGGPAAQFFRVDDESELVTLVRQADEAGEPVLILGGGSNVVAADSGFPGLVIQVATRGIIRPELDCDCGGVIVTVAAGEIFDDLISVAINNEWVGIEALSGIPGTVGATPIQNVGAYGQEVADTIASVRTFDRKVGQFRTFAAAECGFGYRISRFKSEPGRYLVLSVTFQFGLGSLSAPIRFGQLTQRLAVEAGGRMPMAAVRSAVLALRRAKGMVLDVDDHDTWSAGSFFVNPFVAVEELPPGAPKYVQSDGRVKTSAAWLIEQAGFRPGYGSGAVSLSAKHTLAITNRGGATAADVIALADEIRAGVSARFGIDLVPEPTFC